MIPPEPEPSKVTIGHVGVALAFLPLFVWALIWVGYWLELLLTGTP